MLEEEGLKFGRVVDVTDVKLNVMEKDVQKMKVGMLKYNLNF